jgi:hypothetical protein
MEEEEKKKEKKTKSTIRGKNKALRVNERKESEGE